MRANLPLLVIGFSFVLAAVSMAEEPFARFGIVSDIHLNIHDKRVPPSLQTPTA